MTLREALSSGRFVVTAEAQPPKGTAVDEALQQAEELRGRVDAFNVTDQQSSVMRLGSLALCHLLVERGLEPIYQGTCRDRNRIALQTDLLRARARHALAGPPLFFLGGGGSPPAEPVEPQLFKMEKKVRAGAGFFQTQAVFEAERFASFMETARGFGGPGIAGVILLKPAKMARFMNQNTPGIRVPDDLIKQMEGSKDKEGTSAEIAARLVRDLRGLAAGVHIMAMGWEHLIPRVLEFSGLPAPAEAA